MPAYAFEALDAEGATQKGVIEADTAKAARGSLRLRALVPLEVRPVSSGEAAGTQSTRSLFSRPVFSSTGLAIWTRQLAGLVGSGLTLERALTALAEEADNERQHHLLAALRAEVNAGSPFAKALSRFPRDFSDIYIGVVGAGEQSGHLGRVMERLADDLEQRQALNAKLLAATLYPAIVTVAALAIVLLLMT
jgi:general secretion pathway protein F